MDILVVFLIIGALLLFYQLVIRNDDDELDSRGRPRNRKRKL